MYYAFSYNLVTADSKKIRVCRRINARPRGKRILEATLISMPTTHNFIDILGNPLHPTDSVRNLSVWFDSDFSFSKHVQNVCKGCFSQLRDFRNIRQFLTQDAAVSVANARLDYCNSLFRSLSKVNLHRLLSIHNSAARIVTNLCKYTRITPVLRRLQWLPIQFRSEIKLATLVYKFIHTDFPKYFAPHLSRYRTTYNTRHS